MNSQHFTSTYYDLTHGWRGFVVMYVLISLFSLASLKRSHAAVEAYFFWPFTSLATMVVVGLSRGRFRWILSFLFVPPEQPAPSMRGEEDYSSVARLDFNRSLGI
jgi:hypothetical protein